ncbi:hypothetical protein AHiyo8_49550 [Arthrobacter sp. Hiyo8]|nr:hypothetical protein AHiyo8_49550 [Arthrobacter sp. Hiyo8]
MLRWMVHGLRGHSWPRILISIAAVAYIFVIAARFLVPWTE